MKVRFSLFNWKWLSDIDTTEVTITDPRQQAGLDPVTIELDFPSLEKKDSSDISKFVAGGRVYYETEILGTSTLYITGKGFFDKEGYVEPPAPGQSKTGLILGITLPIVIGGVAIGLYIYYKKDQKKKKK